MFFVPNVNFELHLRQESATLGYARTPFGRRSATLGFAKAPLGSRSATLGFAKAPFGRRRATWGFAKAPLDRRSGTLGFAKAPLGRRSSQPAAARNPRKQTITGIPVKGDGIGEPSTGAGGREWGERHSLSPSLLSSQMAYLVTIYS